MRQHPNAMPPWYAPWRTDADGEPVMTPPDPADLGTAFGLDVSLGPSPNEAAPLPDRRGLKRRADDRRGDD